MPEVPDTALPAPIDRLNRQQLLRQKGLLLWFTGLSGAGKSSLAYAVERKLHEMNYLTFVLDGDRVRRGLCGDLDYSQESRAENVRRAAEVAQLFVETGVITLAAFISPSRVERDKSRAKFANTDFLEIYCRCPLAVCESRDVKGLYRQARNGEITNFTGISAAYDEPLTPDLVVDTNLLDLDASVSMVVRLLLERRLIGGNRQ